MKQDITTHYQWSAESPIAQVDVRSQSNGQSVAYLFASPDAPKETLLNIRAALRLKGWGTLSDHRDGKFGLRVSGLKDGRELIDMLGREGYLNGSPQVTTSAVEGATSKNLPELIKNNSLRASAVGYAVGDTLYYKGADNASDKRMALAFGFGDAMLGIFGGRNDTRQYESLLGKLKTHLNANGIEIPKNASIHVETNNQDRGFLGNASDWLHEHINPIKIMSEVLGGYFVLKSGLERDPVLKGNRNPFKIVSGAVIMAGWAGALLVKEKKPDSQALDNAGAVDKLGAFIQEKPLRLAGYAGLTFNALKVTDAVINKRPTSKWNMGAVASMTGANGLYSISNKTTGGDIKTQEMISDVYSVAAQILNKQPEDQRESAIESTAKFLGERPEVRDTHAQVRERLREEMAIQRQNPWFENITLPAHHPAEKSSPTVELAAPVAETSPTPKTEIHAGEIQHHHQGLSSAHADPQLLTANGR